MSASGKFNALAAEEAAEWFVEFRSGDADELMRRRFSEWLTRSPEHVHAYLQTAVIWNEGASLDPRRRFDDAELIALARTEDIVVRWDTRTGVTQLPMQAPRRGAQPPRARRVGLSAALGIAASLVILAVADLTALALHRGVYATETGEQRSIALNDGSTVELNSRSRIRVHFTAALRSVELLEGQALFRVAKDKMRPFMVQSGDANIRAVGTEFDVYRKRQGTVITVIEGRVAVGSVDATSAGEAAFNGAGFIAAGEQLTVTPKSRTLAAPVRANLSAVIAWTQRQLVFESASLSEVAEEMNRYNSRQLVIDDAGLNDFHISGVFSSTDPSSLVKFLRTRPEISVSETGDVIHVNRR